MLNLEGNAVSEVGRRGRCTNGVHR